MNLKNKVALVTGASRGIGKEIARILAKNECNLILNYNNSYSEVLKLKEEISKYNIKILLVKADVSSEDEVKNMIDLSIKEFNCIDILVNNAGIAIDTLFEDKTVDNFKKTLDVNLIGPFLVSKYVGKYMLKNRYGKIINISSTNAIDSYYPESLDYDASKAGVISLTYNLAKQYAPYVNVNAIAPGWINTDMNKELDDEFIKNENKKILLNRFGSSEEIANVVLFLASDKSSYVNGTVIKADGGRNV